MTSDASSVFNTKPNNTPVRLADHSLIEATQKGFLQVPISGNKTIQTLVVPSLHEPLLSVAGMCDIGLTVVFTSKSCNIYSTDAVKVTGKPSGTGY